MIISVHVVSTSFFDWSDHYHNIILIDAEQVSHPAVLQCFRRKTKKLLCHVSMVRTEVSRFHKN